MAKGSTSRSVWSSTKSAASTVGKVVKTAMLPVTVPVKFTYNFVKNHKGLTAVLGAAAAGAVGYKLYDKVENHEGRAVEVPQDTAADSDTFTQDNSSDLEIGG